VQDILSKDDDNLMKKAWVNAGVLSFFTLENALIKYRQNLRHKLPLAE